MGGITIEKYYQNHLSAAITSTWLLRIYVSAKKCYKQGGNREWEVGDNSRYNDIDDRDLKR